MWQSFLWLHVWVCVTVELHFSSFGSHWVAPSGLGPMGVAVLGGIMSFFLLGRACAQHPCCQDWVDIVLSAILANSVCSDCLWAEESVYEAARANHWADRKTGLSKDLLYDWVCVLSYNSEMLSRACLFFFSVHVSPVFQSSFQMNSPHFRWRISPDEPSQLPLCFHFFQVISSWSSGVVYVSCASRDSCHCL